jgi:hypothetical protein
MRIAVYNTAAIYLHNTILNRMCVCVCVCVCRYIYIYDVVNMCIAPCRRRILYYYCTPLPMRSGFSPETLEPGVYYTVLTPLCARLSVRGCGRD